VARVPTDFPRSPSASVVEEAAGITRLIDKLEKVGYVTRERSNPDRRMVLCRITEPGLTLLAGLDPDVAAADEAVLSALSDEELDRLIELLDKARAGRALVRNKAGVRG
jgi:DNA-binding MarR family transcriptional regulator